jgi:hypothetical protein
MKKTVSLLTFTMIMVLILSGCAFLQPSQTTTATPELPTFAPTDIGSPDQKIVTLADSGQTITLLVGESFLLKLGDIYNWDISISDQNVVSRVKNVMMILGAQGIYDALKPGTVTMTATGDPQCRQSVPACMMPSILFSITIVVK